MDDVDMLLDMLGAQCQTLTLPACSSTFECGADTYLPMYHLPTILPFCRYLCTYVLDTGWAAHKTAVEMMLTLIVVTVLEKIQLYLFQLSNFLST